MVDEKQVNAYREKLLGLRSQIINSGILTTNEDLKISSDDLPDETDLATSVINQQVTFNIREKELRKLREIEMALQRIEDGSYGHCTDCGDDIGKKRLENQPWTSLCIVHAEERERESRKFFRQM